jgi:uracil-DNA glycosylase family 4
LTYVPPEGSKKARVLWVGEAPGKTEEKLGRPFVGASGERVRQTLRWAGIDIEDVRFTNAVKINPGKFPSGAKGAELLKQWAGELDRELKEMRRLKVVVACGGPALRRLTGKENISEWRGSVLRNKDLPDVLTWRGIKHVTVMPPGVKVIPTLHPAGVMRSKSRDQMTLFRRDVQKVGLALRGKLSCPDARLFFRPTPHTLKRAAEGAAWCYFDTEYNPYTKEIYWVGVTFNGEDVYGFPWEAEYVAILQEVLKRRIIKGAHNAPADLQALRRMGVDVRQPVWDTMVGYYVLHPSKDLLYGLSHAASFYVDDMKYWKGMDHLDPRYNGLDVCYGAQCMLEQWREMESRPVDIHEEMVSRMRLLSVTEEMESRGLLVDLGVRRELLREVEERLVRDWQEVEGQVKPLWDERLRWALEEGHKYEQQWQEMQTRHAGHCPDHKFNGLRNKPPNCECCTKLFEETAKLRQQYALVKKQRSKFKTLVERWEPGFAITNNEHLRWLLYDALQLPVMRDPNTRKPSAGEDAVTKLATHPDVQGSEAFELVMMIKEAQSLEKAKSTNLLLERKGVSLIDGEGRTHPRYKVHGTETGRLAGGKEEHDERSDNKAAYNALNIPEKWRRMYIAPSGHLLLAADWCNVEGRLTAYFSKDVALAKALREELQGGYKVHAINAGVIYGIDPADAETHKVRFKGKMVKAYKAGKMLTHAWNYLMGCQKMARTYGIPLKMAREIDRKLSERYPTLVGWREQLIREVLGRWERPYGRPRKVCVEPGERYLANPFGWQRYWLGVEGSQANEVVAFLPQSTGASIWTRCALQLREFYPIMTGTYDSFVLVVPAVGKEREKAAEVLRTIMEQPWDEMGGVKFPVEISWGFNWGEYGEGNERGLRAY